MGAHTCDAVALQRLSTCACLYGHRRLGVALPWQLISLIDMDRLPEATLPKNSSAESCGRRIESNIACTHGTRKRMCLIEHEISRSTFMGQLGLLGPTT